VARRSKDPAKVRETILIQATKEFANLGFGGARVDHIAEKSNLSKNMLYYYFKYKEGLFLAVLERMYKSLRSQQDDINVRVNEPVEAMETLIEQTFHALKSDPTTILLINEENKLRGRYIRKSAQVRRLYTPLIDAIETILNNGHAAGIFRSGLDATEIYLMLSSMCYHPLSNQYTFEIALDRNVSSPKNQSLWLERVTDAILLYCAVDPAKAFPSRASRKKQNVRS
jgi:TetR/AcrR family transcriptional regulator